MMSMNRWSLLLGMMILVSVTVAHAANRPLTLEGKQTLYQRVIAVPGAGLVATPGSTSNAQLVTPFTVFYIYERRAVGEREWLNVGTESAGKVDGWLDATQGIEWNQSLTVGFRDPANHPRVLLFGERDALKDLVDRDDAAGYTALRRAAEQGDISDPRVVAIQPDGYIDIRHDFYLVPILSHEDVLISGQPGRLLQVASVPLRDPSAASDYRSGVVFVIDTTVSMGPYIDRTRATMRRVYDEIAAAELSDRASYGLVAFRDNTTAAPGLEFTTRTYAKLGATGDEFLRRAAAVRPATVSSTGFDEDAYAGIAEAIQGTDWDGFFARYIVLITDAGPRLGGDPLAATSWDTESLRRLARDNDVAIWVMHLRTPTGAADHAFAEEQYRQLSTIEGIGDFYYPVETGDVDQFERALAAMTKQLTAQVADAATGRPPMQVATAAARTTSQLATFQQKVARLGYALRMQYVRENTGQSVPAVFDAWIVDRSFEAPEKQVVDVRVLLTRDQLSDLHDVLRHVLIVAEQGTLAPQDFLDELKSLAATVSRDPQAAKTATRSVGGQSLADLGYMREYLEGLPYHSEVMDLNLSAWQQWSAQRQFEYVNRLDGKVAYYRALHDNVDLWVSLDGGPVDGDSVYPLLLDALP